MTETTLSWAQPLTTALRGEEELLGQLRRREQLSTLLRQSLLASLAAHALEQGVVTHAAGHIGRVGDQ